VCHKGSILTYEQTEAGDTYDKVFSESDGLTKLKYAVNSFLGITGFISVKDVGARPVPDHVPEPVQAIFAEGSSALAIGCPNAAGCMFRTAIDLATTPLLPPNDQPEPNRRVRRDLGLRLPWLFESQRIPGDLKPLAECVREDGNDAAHRGTLSKVDAEDLYDFAYELLRRLYTEPERIRLARERRDKRRE
jgi:hypothetical protein